MPLWILSIDMRKAFDTIDLHALMQALRSRNLLDEYVYKTRQVRVARKAWPTSEREKIKH